MADDLQLIALEDVMQCSEETEIETLLYSRDYEELLQPDLSESTHNLGMDISQ